MAERGTGPKQEEVVLRGRSGPAKFLFALALSGVLPMVGLVYLALPAIARGTVGEPRGTAALVTLGVLVCLQVVGFYVIYRDVVGRRQASLQQEIDRLWAGARRHEVVTETLRLANLRLRQMSHTDELTEVGNRRNFDLRLREEVSRSSRFEHAFSLLMIDIDRFRQFNEEFGHPGGDAVLRALGTLMRSVSREGDVPCRVGGEEFAFILPETDKADALVFAERFRLAVEASAVAPDARVPVTVSIGVAAFPEDAKTPEEMVWAADEALYQSKRSGRNRVTPFSRRPEAAEV